jgi:hypothetical protein
MGAKIAIATYHDRYYNLSKLDCRKVDRDLADLNGCFTNLLQK